MGLVVVMCGDAQVHAGVVFQQIDVEDDQGDNGTTSLRMFGVTKVCSSFFTHFFLLLDFFFSHIVGRAQCDGIYYELPTLLLCPCPAGFPGERHQAFQGCS